MILQRGTRQPHIAQRGGGGNRGVFRTNIPPGLKLRLEELRERYSASVPNRTP
jgi:hypothetical protein